MSINLLISKRDELAAQLAAHEAMVADARKQERAEAIEKIKAMAAAHGITADDLRAPVGLKVRHISKASVRTAKPAPGLRYVFGDTSYTTGQRGKPPRAYSEAKRAGTLEVYRVAEGA